MRISGLFRRIAMLAFLSVPVLAMGNEIRLEKLPGAWIGSDEYATGASIETRVALNADGTFTGTATVNRKPFWSFSGTWILVGHDLTWSYSVSTPALPNAEKHDIDEVVSVNEDKLVLKSSRTGEERVFRHPPAADAGG